MTEMTVVGWSGLQKLLKRVRQHAIFVVRAPLLEPFDINIARRVALRGRRFLLFSERKCASRSFVFRLLCLAPPLLA